jgi:hypothetical protein
MFTPKEIRLLQICVGVVDDLPKRADHPMRVSLPTLADRLAEALSLSRQSNADDQAESLDMTDELCGSKQASEITGWAQRTVQRRAAELGGEKIGHAWLFDKQTVLSHAATTRKAA